MMVAGIMVVLAASGCGASSDQSAQTTTSAIPEQLPSGPGDSGGGGTNEAKLEVNGKAVEVRVTPGPSENAQQLAEVATTFASQLMSYTVSGNPPARWYNTSQALRKILSKPLQSRPSLSNAGQPGLYKNANAKPVALSIEKAYATVDEVVDTPFKIYYTNTKTHVTGVHTGIIQERPGHKLQVVDVDELGYIRE